MRLPDHFDSARIFKTTARLAGGCLLVLLLVGCATVEPSRPAPEPAPDRTVQLQIFLDARRFGPGIVDGNPGEFTSKALALYQEAHGLPESEGPDVSGIVPYTSYTVTTDDRAILGTMATGPASLATQRRLPYVRLGEVLAERFHTSERFLRKLNQGMDLDGLSAGATLTVPNIQRPLELARFPSGYPAPSPSVVKHRRIFVDTKARMLAVRDGDQLIAAFPITPGASAHPAPVGEWRVVGAVPWPWYRYDEGVLKRGERTEEFYNLPPGPNSPAGVLWTGLNRAGVGIHGTSDPETIGRAGSHGCIRLSNWDAAVFYTLVRKGVGVTIR